MFPKGRLREISVTWCLISLPTQCFLKWSRGFTASNNSFTSFAAFGVFCWLKTCSWCFCASSISPLGGSTFVSMSSSHASCSSSHENYPFLGFVGLVWFGVVGHGLGRLFFSMFGFLCVCMFLCVCIHLQIRQSSWFSYQFSLTL